MTRGGDLSGQGLEAIYYAGAQAVIQVLCGHVGYAQAGLIKAVRGYDECNITIL